MPNGAPISVRIKTPPVMNMGKPMRIPSSHGRSGQGWLLICVPPSFVHNKETRLTRPT
jgi:hypothetical protein